MSGSWFTNNTAESRKTGPQRGPPKVALFLLLATYLGAIVPAESEYSIPVYSSQRRYVEPKLSDSTHFSENEGRPDASFDGRESRVSSEGCTGVISLPKGRKDPEPRR